MMARRARSRVRGFGWVVVFGVAACPAGADTRYVDDDAPPGGDGTSWATAYRYLRDALDASSSGDEIRVAQGVYRPDQDEGGAVVPLDQAATFRLKNGVSLLGGYAGLGRPDPDARDVLAYESVLSGDLAADDQGVGTNGMQENSFHVVTGNNTDPTSVLEGFTITAGFAATGQTGGGGMFNQSGSPTVRHCTFTRNFAGTSGQGAAMRNFSSTTLLVADCRFMFNSTGSLGRGGAVYNDGQEMRFARCLFIGNTTGPGGNGGGMYNTQATPKLFLCVFSGNAADGGGGMYNLGLSLPEATSCTFTGNSAVNGGAVYDSTAGAQLTNCTLSGNTASTSGGGIFISNGFGPPRTTNCVLWGNADSGGVDESAQIHVVGATQPVVTYSLIEGLDTFSGGAGNIDADPLLVDPDGFDGLAGTADDDLRIRPGSPCIDAGSNGLVPADAADLDADADTAERTPLDLGGDPRFVDDPATPDTGQADPPDYPAVVDMGAFEFQGPCTLDAECADLNPCTVDACSSGVCLNPPVPDGTACSDGVFCNGEETCQSGVCAAGAPVDCSHLDDQCNDGVCNEMTGQCEADSAPYEGADCDDGLFCNVGETCQSGVCTGGAERDCSAEANQCNDGVCNEALDQCQPDPAPHEGAACDDALFCFVGETCQSGVCGGGAARDCSGEADPCNDGICNEAMDQCEADPAPHEGAACDDGLFCNVNETCQSGVCTNGTERDCSHLDSNCSQGVCDEDADDCISDPINEGGFCDDGSACTSFESCQSGVCVGGIVTDCSTLDDPCNTGVCNPSTGDCEADPVPHEGQACNDGLPCTTNDTCQSGVCVGGPAVDCSYLDDPCNTGVCNPSTGACETDPVPHEGQACSDGVPCTTNDTCQSGVCVGGPAVDCSHLDDPCNNGVCDAASGLCEADPAPHEDDPCDDGSDCTVGETCQAGVCTGGTPFDCSHLNSFCSIGVCNGATGQCSREARNEGASCEDGLFCTVGTTCAAGDCTGGGQRDCSAFGNACNVGVCNETLDLCQADPEPLDGADCDDDLFCNGRSICSNGVCKDGEDPCPGVQRCDEDDRRCFVCESHADCDDEQFCNGSETCAGGFCVPGADPCPEQFCDEQEQRCFDAECTDAADCDDGDRCTINGCRRGRCVFTPIEGCADTDDDGVLDAQDRCPNTPAGAAVSIFGCSCAQLDDDDDGVDNCADLCPGTVAGSTVDAVGCPEAGAMQLVIQGPSELAAGSSAAYSAEIQTLDAEVTDVTDRTEWQLLDTLITIGDNVQVFAATINADGMLSARANLSSDVAIRVVARVTEQGTELEAVRPVTLLAGRQTDASGGTGTGGGGFSFSPCGFGMILPLSLSALVIGLVKVSRSSPRRRHKDYLTRPGARVETRSGMRL